MRLYKTEGFDTPQGEWVRKWDGTQADAAATRKNFKTIHLSMIETKEVDVPTDKQGLLKFLNANAAGE